MNQYKQPEALRLADDRPTYKGEDLYQWAIDAEDLIRRQHARIAELEEDLKFVERWAVHHGSKPSFSAKQALSVIQHYPSIKAITDSYADGKRPDTFNPYARIAELEAELEAVKVGPDAAAVVPFGYINTYTGQFFKDVEPCRKTNEGHWRTVYVAPQAQDVQDASRYRWLRDESWACYNIAKKKPEVALVACARDSAGNVKTILAEEAMDEAIDAAIAASAKGGV